MTPQSLLNDRKVACQKKLDSLKQKIKSIKILNNRNDICIYVTGSYGRFEATEYSDLDIFILKDGSSSENQISKIEKTLLDAELIKIARKMGFGEFSNDGQYLEIHHIDDMLNNLGCAEDDYKNYFTARMLLLLESYPLFNEKLYNKMIKKIINSYFRDYHDHDIDFRPIFFINDIMRYYKTMCLNYEHKRNRPTTDIVTKNKSHLKNLKLKFSRLLTCYSTILALIQKKSVVNPDKLLKIVHKTPIEKFSLIKNLDEKKYTEILELYTWFLIQNDRPLNEVLKWIGKRSNRNNAFKKGRVFHQKIYFVLEQIAHKTDLMYLTI